MSKLLTSMAKGAEIIREYARNLPLSPGVYRMIDQKGEVLYVGKAKALKKRVMSYTRPDKLPIRMQRMIAITSEMAFTQTHTEAEALLLEANMIKKLKPRFNILLRDDKSFPYIMLTGDHDYPLLTKHRGPRKRAGEYYGPFASAGAVNQTITALYKGFRLRNCSDNVFAQRKRPCLQYHIKRCTAPCVGYVSREDYAEQVADARAFLEGKSRAIQEKLVRDMEAASEALEFEKAAQLRDRVTALTSIQARQDINSDAIGDADVFGLAQSGGQTCVQVFFVRIGQNYGNRAYFPRHDAEEDSGTILSAFIGQFYQTKPVPKKIICSHVLEDADILAEALSELREKSGEKAVRVEIEVPKRGRKKRVVDMVISNAEQALARERNARAADEACLDELADLFDLPDRPARIEVYDNSHTSGGHQVGAMIVTGPEGLQKSAYRKFNIRDAAEADDYGMMREVMRRRFRGLAARDETALAQVPDLVLIDGGAGQLSAVRGVLEDMGVWDDIHVVAIAKGPDRNAGRETFFTDGKPSFTLPKDSAALHYLQRLRDEAHRFAIGAHRARRGKTALRSALDDIAGIGPARKKALLQHFGSAEAVKAAGIEDIAKVDGISIKTAEVIYSQFHES